MFRRVRCIAIAFACFALMVASSQAGPIKPPPRESSPGLESMADAWDWLVSVLRKVEPTAKLPLDSATAEDGVSLDPNGAHH